MALRVVGAGLPRTGTSSLKLALERLLGAPCYHMTELSSRPDRLALWHAAALTGQCDWEALFDGFAAAVDYPPSAFWPELAERYPEALVLLSRRDPAAWWRSADATVLGLYRRPESEEDRVFKEMVTALFVRDLDPDFLDPERAMAAALRREERVRATVPASRLLEWSAGDGWAPLCAALGVPVPDEPFPHENTTEVFQSRQRQRTET